MATAPRQGRKGGKISSATALGMEDHVSPSSLAMPRASPSATDGFLKTPPLAAATASTDSNVLQLDLDAIQHVCQGVIIGRAKVVRTGMHKATTSRSEVVDKLKEVLKEQSIVHAAAAAAPAKGDEGLEQLQRSDVVLVSRPRQALALAVTTARVVESAMVLVVVPTYDEVNLVASNLRAKAVHDGKRRPVGVLIGQTFSGSTGARLWVTSADTLFLLVTSTRNVSPFTHIVFPGLSHATQLQWYTLAALRMILVRGKREGASVTRKLVLTFSPDDHARVSSYFGECTTETVECVTRPVVEFSYDEACALVDRDVLAVEADRTGKCTATHTKVINFSVEVATLIVQHILAAAKQAPQSINIFTCDGSAMLASLQLMLRTEGITNCNLFSGRVSVMSGDATIHNIHVASSVVHCLDTDREPTFVIDLGTVKKTVAGSKSEGFMTTSTTEWESKKDVAQRKAILGSQVTGGYIAVYPESEAANFADETIMAPNIAHLEEALQQCARDRMPPSHDTIAPPVPVDTIKQVMHDLAEKCVTANPTNLSLTFLGEVVARLPLGIDLSYFTVLGCILGLGEAATAVAAVAALPFRWSTPFNETKGTWASCTVESRTKYAEGISKQSDLLADTLVFLAWLKLRVSGADTTAFIAETHISESRLEQIKSLMDFLRIQLSDYVFLDNATPEVVDATCESLRVNTSIFLFMKAASLARCCAFIRDSGSIGAKCASASLVFVRSSKKVVPDVHTPTCVTWETGAILAQVHLKNSGSVILPHGISTLNASYFFAALLLLYPQVEYSRPVGSDKGNVIHFGLSCNGQMKRYRVSIEEAAQILDFREKLNRSLGCLQALRMMHRPTTRAKFLLHLKSEDRLFDLSTNQRDLQRQLVDLVLDVEVAEHQGSFETFAVHCIAPKEILPPVAPDALPSDVVMLKELISGTLLPNGPAVESVTPSEIADGGNVVDAAFNSAAATSRRSPASQAEQCRSDPSDTLAKQQSAVRMMHGCVDTTNVSPSTRPILYEDDDDDDIQVAGVSYFLTHGPLIEDDDDE